MNGLNSVVVSEKCGFCDIDCRNEFKILTPNDDLNIMVGQNTDGLSYIDIVCPEDKDDVLQKLTEVFETGEKESNINMVRACIRHRIMQPDKSVVMVMLTVKYADGCLQCAIAKTLDSVTGDAIKYKSNNIIESIAISAAVVFITDGGHIIIKYANDDFYDMLGWNRLEFKEFFNECLNDIIYQSDFKLFFNELNNLSFDNIKASFDVRMVMPDGSIRWNEVRAKYLLSEDERPVISLVLGGITERKKIQRELAIQNERFNIIQNSTEQLIFDYDAEKDVIVFTGNIKNVFEYVRLYDVECIDNELIINNFFGSRCALTFMNKEYYEQFCDKFSDAIISGSGGTFDFVMSTIDDAVGIWHKCIFSVVEDDWGSVIRIVGRFKNIDRQKKNELVLERRIKCDTLTGLLNKDATIRYINEFLDNCKNISDMGEKLHALMIIDLDNFRMINDSLGHTFGDIVIQEFASDIKSSFRDTDIVGRIGGDEFMILMKNVTVKSATKKAGRLCRSLVKRYSVHNKNICLSCSIGVAFFGKDTYCFEDLYKYADIAMYNAKINGRCSYEMYESDAAEVTEMLKIHNRTQMDPPVNSTESGELDTNLLDVAFSLIATSDDIWGTLDILLRTVGRKYNLSAVSILVKNYEKNKLCSISNWHSTHIQLKQGWQCPFINSGNEIDSLFNGSNLKCISDVTTCNLPPVIKNQVKNMGVGACIIGKLEGRSGLNYGYIVFSQFERKRKWSRKEINTFKYISKIISISLVDKRIEHTLPSKE